MGDGDAVQSRGGIDTPAFPTLLEQFHRTLEAILEMLDAVSPHVASLDDKKEASAHLQLSDRGREKFAEVVNQARDGEPGVPSKDDGEADSLTNDEEIALHVASKFVEDFADDPTTLRRISRMFLSKPVRPHRQNLLHASLLTMAIGTLETAIAGVGTQHYVLHPSALPGGEKEFSLAELSEFEDLQDARDLAIARRVEALMRGGLESWDKWFGELLGIHAKDLAADYWVLHEAIQRRHLVVHNAGRVSRQYKSRVPSCEQSVGQELLIDREYLDAAIDSLAIFGTRLILLAWAKWQPDEKLDVATEGNNIAVEHLSAGRNLVARCLAHTAAEFANADHQLRLFLQVNEWQAEKRINGLESIEQAVRAWDTSALSPQFEVAKAALLEDYDALFNLLPQLLETEELDFATIRRWPLFKEAREHEEWSHLEETFSDAEEHGESAGQ